MTGFARAHSENGSYFAEVELRSVNHRYQEIRVKAPSSLSHLESKVRNRVAARVKRGKVDVSVRLKPKQESAYQLELDRPLMEDFVKVARTLGSELDIPGGLGISDLVGFHPAFTVKDRDLSATESPWEVLASAVDKALEEHGQMSQAEGARLAADLEARLRAIVERVDEIEKHTSANKSRRRQELIDKVSELNVSGIEPSALAMEVAKLVERSDIAEEITRLRSHFSLWKDATTGEEPCGKKLDFILQEMNREVNTIGSKSQDADITERVIAVKSELERIREQVQNIQ